MRSTLRSLTLCCLLAAAAMPAGAQQAQQTQQAQQADGDRTRKERGDRNQQQPDRPRPPAPDAVTRQTLDLPGRSLHVTATAGFVRILGEDGTPEADIGTTAYTLDGADPATRPVTFVVNGGPGMASAWLQMGAVGPWRIPFVPGPSASPVPQPNADTWLDFTDLVFIDPPGTGYGTVLPPGDAAAKKRLWSVDGDIDALSQAIRRWLDRAGRIATTKYLLGESYGGFRGPRLARRLAQHDGVGLRGLVLVSPLFDYGNRSGALDVLGYAAELPSMAAAARADRGEAVARADLAEAEAYATGPFLADVLRGLADPAALARVVDRVVAFTGLDPAVIRQHRGLVNAWTFQHQHDRAAGRIDSAYDATVTLPDPYPEVPEGRGDDPMLGGLFAPVTGAVLAVYDRLRWHPDGQVYRLFDPEIPKQWDYGRGFLRPQSFDALRQALALDPQLHVLIGHGLFDLVTPFEGTQILLNQLPAGAGGDRVRLVTLPGGHMFYSRDESRAAFRAEAARLIGGLDR
ncbi:S10 family peptidase [Lichenibacterium ramalinae]|uniref:Peptidase S10 n=1 Tax=Lichenibacterium ramalinae TaxID=2316527 RepID=A0A4Q2RD63_9HYPH|nr:peptidase S10 [Lichenibacterium ramalinae]RYB03122.1 peptidase S10 [Lichenibacterium ramalinae]